jgi:hypothetical protein
MTFTALLIKELRLRLRRERFVWLIIIYLLVMGLLGFGFLQRANAFSGGYQGYLLSQIGAQLYALLSFIQLFLIVFIAPAFTATAINGEKERQTDRGVSQRAITDRRVYSTIRPGFLFWWCLSCTSFQHTGHIRYDRCGCRHIRPILLHTSTSHYSFNCRSIHILCPLVIRISCYIHSDSRKLFAQ